MWCWAAMAMPVPPWDLTAYRHLPVLSKAVVQGRLSAHLCLPLAWF